MGATRLTHGDAELIEATSTDLLHLVFEFMDGEWGGEIAGKVAAAACRACEEALTGELAVEAGQAPRGWSSIDGGVEGGAQ